MHNQLLLQHWAGTHPEEGSGVSDIVAVLRLKGNQRLICHEAYEGCIHSLMSCTHVSISSAMAVAQEVVDAQLLQRVTWRLTTIDTAMHRPHAALMQTWPCQ
jgi:hypothetical protein